MQNFGQFVSSVTLDLGNHVPGNPVTPPGAVIDHISYPGDPSLQFGQAVSEFIHDLHNPVTNFDLLHVQNFGQFVSSVTLDLGNHIPGEPLTPPGAVIDHISFPGDPSLQFGQAVSEFIHDLHNPVTNFDLLL